MSIIGSSPGIISGQTLKIGPVLAVGSSDRNAAPVPGAPAVVAAPTAAVVTSTASDAGTVPVDQARVASIKKAIQNNSYPLTPARIGDAMIAAGMLLRMPK